MSPYEPLPRRARILLFTHTAYLLGEGDRYMHRDGETIYRLLSRCRIKGIIYFSTEDGEIYTCTSERWARSFRCVEGGEE